MTATQLRTIAVVRPKASVIGAMGPDSGLLHFQP